MSGGGYKFVYFVLYIAYVLIIAAFRVTRYIAVCSETKLTQFEVMHLSP